MIDATQVAAKPEELGIERERLEAVFARAKREVDDGTLPSVQVAVARHGKLAGMRTFGTAIQGGAERPATDDTLYHIFSCTKAIIAAGVWLLFESGDLGLDERVAEIIPEFGTNGKDVITVEQLMLHAGGFPYAPFAPRLWASKDARLEAFSRWRLNWPVDSRYEYHPTSAHWVLVEIIERKTGMDYKRFIRERITGPLGLAELYIGRPVEQNARVADVRWMGEPVEPPGGWGEVTPEAILRSNELEYSSIGAPGGSGVASAASLALFYQALINGGESASGARIMKRDTIAFATQVRSKPHHVDRVTNVFANRGLSIVVAGDDGQAFMRGFGRTCSGRAIGHGGAGGQIAWGDPETGISVGFCTDGFVGVEPMGRRITAISSLASNCAI
jgi:CubicO group peptidase (beta-lactamase class C family)